MVLSRQNLSRELGVIAAFSLGGFVALQSGEADPGSADQGFTVSEIAPPEPSQRPTPQASDLKLKQSYGRYGSGNLQSGCAKQMSKNFKPGQKISAGPQKAAWIKAAEYAAYIRERPALKGTGLLVWRKTNQMAISAGLLVASFKYLEPQDKLNLSQALMSSSAWDIRRKTTSLLTSQDVLATQDAAQIASSCLTRNRWTCCSANFKGIRPIPSCP